MLPPDWEDYKNTSCLCLISSERDVKGTNQLATLGALTEFSLLNRVVFGMGKGKESLKGFRLIYHLPFQ